MQRKMPILRKMKESDAHAIAQIEKKTFTDAWSEKSILDTFYQNQAFVVVAEAEEKIVGYCIVYFVLDEGEIARIAVAPNVRRQGVGHLILDEVEKICTGKSITKLLLDVRESNRTARAFYSGYGFSEDGIRKDFYESPKENAVLMSKPITYGKTGSSSQ